MTKPTELNTERLLLRPFSLSDIDDVLDYASDPDWAAFYPRPYDRGSTEYMVAQAVLSPWDKKAEFAIVFEGRVVGLVELTVDPKNQTTELGYSLLREQWGQAADTPDESNYLFPIAFRV